MQTVLVTGGSGFVGRNLIRALVARGDRVLALARTDSAAATVAGLGATAVKADLATVTAEQLRGCDTVFHAAAMVDDWGPRAKFEQVNVEGTRHLLDVSRSAGVACFVHVGTEAIYAVGPPLIDLDETRPIPEHPLPRYPASKAAAEKRVCAANSPQMRTVVIRPRLIWGADDTSVLPQIVELVKQGKFAWIDGGHYLSSTCHVHNVVEGALLAAEKGRGGEAYFLTDGAPVEFRSFMTRQFATRGVVAGERSLPRALIWPLACLIEFLWEHLHLRGRPPLTRTAVVLGCQQVTVSDAKARRELGYLGKTSIEDGLAALQDT
ncbi:MAG TPA: NAD-dependent epimerase/dehydratase family protein [Stenotrophobium sp.]|jgi:nucleoside-diphosphate-sugar epimerase|nr:NAD-dependent epimerase/dehydratase family protein [Stenotrophobium sp.]